MKRRRVCLFVTLILLRTVFVFGQQGKDGNRIITSNAILNEYTSLTADALSGNTSLTVGNSTLNDNSRFSGPLAAGDLIMVIQMQGAAINGTAADSTWGAVTNYNNCGLYEFAEIAGIPNSTTINLSCSLKNGYTAAGKTQVVRVPRFSSLKILSGGTLTCSAWDGTKGGIVTAEVKGNTEIESGGFIDATGKGFRGGVTANSFGPDVTHLFVSNSNGNGSAKGESIAGYNSDYNIYGGMYCKGAPANGGGGGNSWNCSGGGGANAGILNEWTGNGTPDTTNPSWIAAWNLEYNGFAYSHSSGGGRGGYSPGEVEQNALILGPDEQAWDSRFYRSNDGGKGGRPLDYSGGRIFFGGGGGAGNQDNSNGGNGGSGGGIIYLLSYGTVSGAGTLRADGNKGGNNNAPSGTSGDGSGGGGGGGTIMIYSAGNISGISLQARGGNGGDQVIARPNESEGPGGGGGGGYIALSNTGVTTNADGGKNGTSNAVYVAEFPPNGGTKGGDGLANEAVTTVPFSTVTADAGSDVQVCPGAETNLLASGGTSYTWLPVDGLSCTNCSGPVASPSVTTTYTVTVMNGSCLAADEVTVQVNAGGTAGTVTALRDTICSGTPASLSAIGSSANLQWQSSFTTGNFINVGSPNSTTLFDIPTQTIFYRVFSSGTGSCSDTSDVYQITVQPSPVANFTCDSTSLTVTFNSSSSSVDVTSHNWDFGDGFTSTEPNPVHTYAKEDTFHVCLQVENGSNCSFTICRDVKAFKPSGMNSLKEAGWLVTPNPFTDRIIIQAPGNEVKNIVVYNLIGEIALEKTFAVTENPVRLDLSVLTEGIYFLEMRSGEREYTRLLIKQ